MPDTPEVHLIPLAEIDADALPRDRTCPDPAAQVELRDSILRHGLRMPIEVWRLAEPRPPFVYGLISGWRRLGVFREMDGYLEGRDHAYAAIPAFVRTLDTLPALLTAVAEENAVRAAVSPWEQGRFIVCTVEAGAFANIEEAVDALFPTTRTNRWRLRAVAHAVAGFDGMFSRPETLSLRQVLRIEAACRKGFDEDLEVALRAVRGRNPGLQWEAVEPILREAETEPVDTPLPDPRVATGPGRPRRVIRIRPHLTIRRERMSEREGYRLLFYGRDATAMVVQDIMDEIERMWGRE